jgi:hypothetical protein
MGANPTQAQGLVLFLVAFVLIAGALAAGGSLLYGIAGIALLCISVVLFLKCKPWESRED